MGRLLAFLAAWIFTALYWLSVLALHLLSFKRLPAPWLNKLIHAWGRATLAILGIRLEILNESTISTRSSRVVIVNHESALDLVWGAAICPPAPLAIGKREVIYIPVINLIWWALDFIRIDRSNHAKAIAALFGVSETIALENRSLVISPEGTRTHDGTMGRFKKGAFHIARQAGVPICPVVAVGAYELLPRQRLLPRRGVIKLSFLPPISTEGLTREGEEQFIAQVRQDMINAHRDIASGYAGCKENTT